MAWEKAPLAHVATVTCIYIDVTGNVHGHPADKSGSRDHPAGFVPKPDKHAGSVFQTEELYPLALVESRMHSCCRFASEAHRHAHLWA